MKIFATLLIVLLLSNAACSAFNLPSGVDNSVEASVNSQIQRPVTGTEQSEQIEEPTLDVLLQQAEAFEQAGDQVAALVLYDQIIAMDAQQASAYIGRANLYTMEENFDQALLNLKQAIGLEPDNAYLYALRCTIYLFQNGAGQNEIHQTRQACNEAVNKDDQYAYGYIKRGDFYILQGQQAEALADYQRATELEPKLAYGYVQQGNIVASQEKLEEALNLYDQAIALDPTYAQAYLKRGLTLRYVGDLSAALADFDQTLLLQPDNSVALLNRGYIYQMQKEYENALADFDSAIKSNAEHANLFHTRGELQYQLQNFDAAIADFNAALDLDPELNSAYFNLGLLYDTSDNTGEAVTYFRRFLLLYPVDDEFSAYAQSRISAPRSLGDFAAQLFMEAANLPPAPTPNWNSNPPEQRIEYSTRYYNPDTGRYQNTYCSNCREEWQRDIYFGD
ncbi:MAG: tetratricopeptide repeat protein [Chloroflexota bacterium]